MITVGPVLFSSAGRRREVKWFMIKGGFIVVAVSELDFHHENCKFKIM